MSWSLTAETELRVQQGSDNDLLAPTCVLSFTLYGHPQVTGAQNTKIATANFILVQNAISVCHTMHINNFFRCLKVTANLSIKAFYVKFVLVSFCLRVYIMSFLIVLKYTLNMYQNIEACVQLVIPNSWVPGPQWAYSAICITLRTGLDLHAVSSPNALIHRIIKNGYIYHFW